MVYQWDIAQVLSAPSWEVTAAMVRGSPLDLSGRRILGVPLVFIHPSASP